MIDSRFVPVNGEAIDVSVDPGEQVVIPLTELVVGEMVTGTISISGGGNEIKYWVIDPDGNTVLHLGPVVRGRAFEFSAQTNGVHSARLDNRESTAAKTVKIEFDVRTEGDTPDFYYWGKILVVLVTAFSLSFYLRARWRRSG